MKVVAIMGAGASVAEAISHRPKQTREHPPLDTNFFSRASQLEPPLRAALTRLVGAVGLPDPFGSPEPRMEEVFGDLYFEVVESDGIAQQLALDAYRTLLRVYSRVLAQSTNWMWDRPLGALGRYLRTTLQIPNLSRLTLITFNHDLILENALVQLPYRARWCVDRGYGPIDLTPTPTARRFASLPAHSDDCDHTVSIELLKLHGSLNWQVRTRSHDPSYGDLFPSPDARHTIECITDRVVSINLQRRIGNRRWRLWPQIVPPIYQKRDIVSSRFSELWKHASLQLEEADSIAMIGYSIPPTDVHSANLIKRAIRRNTGLWQVHVVNPDPGVAARVGAMGNLQSVMWHRDLPSYTESLTLD